MGVAEELATSGAAGSVMVMVAVPEQLPASVTVKDQVPAARVNVPVPVYGGVPPVALTVTVEVPPLHSIGVALALTFNTDPVPWMVMVTVAEQPLASVTVYVCVPAGALNVPVPLYGGVPPEAVTVTVE